MERIPLEVVDLPGFPRLNWGHRLGGRPVKRETEKLVREAVTNFVDSKTFVNIRSPPTAPPTPKWSRCSPGKTPSDCGSTTAKWPPT
ncbi:MAG: hypothetical protein R2709_10245 [Marmoricola sp.]